MSNAQTQARWRAKNPERARELVRNTAKRWQEDHPGENYFAAHRDPAKASAWKQGQIARNKAARAADPETWRARDRAMRAKWNGIPERTMHQSFQSMHPTATSFDLAACRPDFYLPGVGFVEIKRALTFRSYSWRYESPQFPGLFFLHNGGVYKGQGSTIDQQIAAMPRPLTVIIFHGLTGEELQRETFL